MKSRNSKWKMNEKRNKKGKDTAAPRYGRKFIIDKRESIARAGTSGRVQSGHDPEPCEERVKGRVGSQT